MFCGTKVSTTSNRRTLKLVWLSYVVLMLKFIFYYTPPNLHGSAEGPHIRLVSSVQGPL